MSVAKQTLLGVPKARDAEFEGILLGALVERREERDAERKLTKGDRDALYVSEVGTILGESACHRKLFYDFHNAPKDPLPAETLMAFEVGDVVGLRVANILAGSGHVTKVELPMDFAPVPMRGRLDVLMVPSLKRLVEVKTSPVEQLPYLPKEEHIRQTNMYLHALRQNPETEDYQGTLAYVFKNARKGQPILQAYKVTYDAHDAIETLNATSLAYRAATGDALPGRPLGFTRSKYPCAYCGFLTHCWSRQDSPNAQGVPF